MAITDISAGADTARTRIAYLEEATWGESPAAALKALRVTGESLGVQLGHTSSNEIRDDRQVADLTRTTVEAGGGLEFELSLSSFDPFFAGALFSTWKSGACTTDPADTGDLTFADNDPAADTISAATADSLAGIPAGAAITVSGTAGNDGTYTVASNDGTVITLESAESLVDATESAAVLTSPVVGDTSLQADASGNKIISSSLDLSALGLEAGRHMQIAGFDAGANNGIARIESVSADEIAVSGLTLETDTNAGGHVITLKQADVLENGTTARSFTLERQHADVGQYFTFTGMMINRMALSFNAGQMLSGRFSFIGKDGSRSESSAGVGDLLPAESAPVTNAVTDIGALSVDGSTPSAPLRSLALSVENGLRGQRAIGSESLAGVGAGRCSVSGSLEAYFADGDLYDRFREGTETALSWRISDADGAAFLLSLPRVRLTNAQVNAGGADQDVMAAFDLQALVDETTGKTLRLERLSA